MNWNEIWMSLSENLIWVSIMFGLFALCMLSNISAKVYYQVRHIDQDWNSVQLTTSILRMPAIGISTAMPAVGATIAPLILSYLGLINKEFCKLISVSMIIGMYVRGIVKYFKEALDTVDYILANRDVVIELQNIPDSGTDQETNKETPNM